MPVEWPFEYVEKLLRYEPDTGKLFWKPRDASNFPTAGRRTNVWNTRYAGKEAMTATTNWGYKNGPINYQVHLAHRVAWLLSFGRWPAGQIDHINGVRGDNRLANLRDVTAAENSRNLKRDTRNRSGVTGVWQSSQSGKWHAYINSDRRRTFLGSFPTMEEATAARRNAERRLDFHQNHGQR